MPETLDPALKCFLAQLGEEYVWGQLFIQKQAGGFLLRHILDRQLSPNQLRQLHAGELRKMATFTRSGEFRPLRAAPDLQTGWAYESRTAEDLGRALHEIYPGSLADWFATQSSNPPITNYREFVDRQSGMYRITQFLTDEQAASVTLAACAPQFCLKRRLWSVSGIPPENAGSKSLIPCLEPCAILLELARKAARLEQEEKVALELPASDLESIFAAVEALIQRRSETERVADIASATNPRRLQLLLEKFRGKVKRSSDTQTEE